MRTTIQSHCWPRVVVTFVIGIVIACGAVVAQGQKQSYAPQVAAVKSDEELHDLLDRMVQELKVSHHRVYDMPTLQRLIPRIAYTGDDHGAGSG